MSCEEKDVTRFDVIQKEPKVENELDSHFLVLFPVTVVK